jgi:cyclopropane fatty-acyl-phospholipid synthase-like methyltransferase
VIEFGCGDGNQLAALVVDDYLGVDLSAVAIEACRSRYAGVPGRRFTLLSDYRDEQADGALSLDVIYHLIEDASFERYMQQLFAAARRVVIVYSSNHDDPEQTEAVHVRHREFTRWVAAHAPAWRRVRHIANEFPFRGDYRSGSFADFHVFVRGA